MSFLVQLGVDLWPFLLVALAIGGAAGWQAGAHAEL